MSVNGSGEPEITDQWVVRRRDLPQLTVHSWSRDGRMLSAWPGDRQEPPVDACRIGLRIVNFPGGAVREIFLDKEARTHPHPSYEAVLFYQIDGRRVQMVNERSHQLNPGDACLQPTGVQHSTFQLVAGLFVEFALPAPRLPNPEATWITASAARVVRRDSDAVVVKVFDLPGYPLFETSLAEGAAAGSPGDEPVGQLFYVVEGRLQATLGGRPAEEVSAGDSLRCPPGRRWHFSAIEDAVFIQTAAPDMPKARQPPTA